MASVEEVFCGWLVKSPPSKFVNLLKGKVPLPVKAKWRKRFFRLYKSAESYTHKFAYYQDESLQKKHGSIKLEHCVGIQANLDSACYPHLFALQTMSRNSNRVYYLAADTEQEMANWVNNLCNLCNLQDSSKESEAPLTSLIPEPTFTSVTESLSSNNRDSYKELADSTSGFGDSSSFNQSADSDDGVYKSPSMSIRSQPVKPSPRVMSSRESSLADYVVPPAPVPLTSSPAGQPRSHTDSQIEDGGYDEDYENSLTIIQQMQLAAEREVHIKDAVPPRPPKPSNSNEQEYTNVPFGSPPHGARHHLDNLYDIPKNLSTAPPPCLGPNAKLHKYINASSKVLDIQDKGAEPPSSDLNQPVKPARGPPSRTSAYLTMYSPTDVEPSKKFGHLRPSDAYDILPPSNRTSAASNVSEDVYEVPPTARPINSTDQSAPAAKLRSGDGEEVIKIVPTTRTRSYIRSSTSDGTTPNNDEILLPSKLGGTDESSDEMSSEESDSEPLEELKPPVPAHIDRKLVTPHPAARISRPEPMPRKRITAPPSSRVEYVDLDKSALTQGRKTVANATQTKPSRSTVQYMEVDLLKTATALNKDENH